MPIHDKTRTSSTLINLTDQTINLYDIRTGNICEFLPEQQELPKLPQSDLDNPVVHYVLSQEQFTEIAKTERPLDDIALINNEGHGRNNIPIVYLVWGKDPETKVILYSNTFRSYLPY